MRLVLEGLGVVQPQRMIVDALVDQIHLIEAEDALRDSLEEVDVLLHTYHSLESIQYAIQKCGVTQSIVQLYGENFSSMESDQPGDAEKEVGEKKQGVLRRTWEAIKSLFEKFIDWIGSLFSNVIKIKTQLKKTISNADKCNYPFSAITMSLPLMIDLRKYLSKLDSTAFTSSRETIVRNFEEIKEYLKSDLSKDNERIIHSSQDLIEACNTLSTLLDDINKIKKLMELNLRKWTKLGDTKFLDIDATVIASNYRDSVALCKDIIQATITSSKNIITAAEKAQK